MTKPNIFKTRKAIVIQCPDHISMEDGISALDPFQHAHPVIPGRVCIPSEAGFGLGATGQLVAVAPLLVYGKVA